MRLPIFRTTTLLLFLTFLAIGKAASTVTPLESSSAAEPIAIATATAAPHGYLVEGRVKVPGIGVRVFPSVNANIKVTLNGGQEVELLHPDGKFSFQGVKPGNHLLEVSALGYRFSPVRVDVSARLDGQIRASAVETGRYYQAWELKPLREEVYYEKRKPFSVMAFLMNPEGLMAVFMVVGLICLSLGKDSNDPKQIRRMHGEMWNQERTSSTRQT